MDDQQRARELLALGLDEYGHHNEATNVRLGIDLDCYQVELWSITASLRAAPEGFVLVPVRPTKFMMDAAIPPSRQDQTGRMERAIWDAMIAARPQGVKDAT